MTLWKWSQTAASNDDIDSTINFQEGQAARTLNNSARAMMAAVAKWRDDISGNLVTAGTSTAYTLTTNQGLTSLTDGFMVRARMNATSGTDPTLNVDSLGAKDIVVDSDATNIPIGALLAKRIYTFTYDSTADAWIVEGVDAQTRIGTLADFAGGTVPNLWLLCYGQAVSRTTYAALFAVLGTTWGAGDGSTTFNVPDIRGRVTAGKDDMGGAAASRLTTGSSGVDGSSLGGGGGAQATTLSETHIPTHSHTFSATTSDSGTHTHSYGTDNFLSASGGGSASISGGGSAHTSGAGGNHNHTLSGTTSAVGSGTAFSNVQPTSVTNKIIFAGA